VGAEGTVVPGGCAVVVFGVEFGTASIVGSPTFSNRLLSVFSTSRNWSITLKASLRTLEVGSTRCGTDT